MARAFLYVALAAGVCVLQTTAVQAEPGNRTQSNEDVEDETVTLGFGALPAGVGAGDPSSATLTIYDTPAASLRGVPETPTNASSKITSGLATVSFAENATGAGVFLISAARDSARVDSGEHTVGDHKKTETPDTLAGRRDEAQALADLAERLEMLSTKRTNNRDGERIAAKLSRGFVGGILSGFVGLWAGGRPASGSEEALLLWKGGREALWTGYIFGTAFGVSTKEPSDQFLYSLGPSLLGSLLGFGAGIGMAHATDQISFVFVLPPIMATFASEWSRKPSEARRLSVGLVPTPTGGLSAVATLRL